MVKCGTCAIWLHNGGICPYLQRQVGENETACTNYTTTTNKCVCCGKGFFGNGNLVLDNNDKYITMCDQCTSHLSECITCGRASLCPFETDPNPLPKLVQKQIRQGPAVMIQTVRNPDRIAATCASKCKCWSEKFRCGKEYGLCPEWSRNNG